MQQNYHHLKMLNQSNPTLKITSFSLQSLEHCCVVFKTGQFYHLDNKNLEWWPEFFCSPWTSWFLADSFDFFLDWHAAAPPLPSHITSWRDNVPLTHPKFFSCCKDISWSKWTDIQIAMQLESWQKVAGDWQKKQQTNGEELVKVICHLCISRSNDLATHLNYSFCLLLPPHGNN